MTELTEETINQYLKDNLKVERTISFSITVNGKEYRELISREELLKVYDRILKGEQIFVTKMPRYALESLKAKILEDKNNKNNY
jgi:hypothetical protein